MTLTEPDGTSVPAAENRDNRRTSGRSICAGVLSAFVPGLGQFLRGRKLAGTIFFLFYAGFWLCFWPLRGPHNFYVLCALIWGIFLLALVSSLHAGFTSDSRHRRLSAWWAFLFITLVFASLYPNLNWPMRAGGFKPFWIPSTSMETTVLKGDEIVADMRGYSAKAPQVGDIVIFRRENLYVIKRVEAVGGDTIYGKNGAVFLNGTVRNEPYATHTMEDATAMYQLQNFGPVRVPMEKIFVIGDNRDVSYDSRMPEYGLIDVRSVIARPLYVLRRESRSNGIPIR